MGPKRLQYPEEAMQAALHSVKEGSHSLREAAKLHGVPHTTLRDRLKGKKSIRKLQRTVLSVEHEGRLVSWLEESARRGFGKSKTEVLNTVQRIVADTNMPTPFKDGRPGRKWFCNFMQRHKKVIVRTPQALGSQIAAARKVKAWFDRAYEEIMAVDPHVLNHPNRIFNCDETGFQLGGGITRVVAPKGDKRVYQVTHNTHKQVTILACGSASGDVHPPLLIFPGQRFSFNPLAGYPEAHFSKSVNGRIDSQIFGSWLRTAFIPAVADLEKPVILFVDGHKTHLLSLEVSDLCRDHNIILYQLPSHYSHIVQPLDLTTFKDLKQAWREEVINYQIEKSDNLGKREFSHVLKKAWQRGIQKDVVISGFRAAGIYPWDPDHVDLTKLGPSTLFKISTVTDDFPKETAVKTEADTMTETCQNPDDTVPTETQQTPDDTVVTDDNAIIPLSPNLSLSSSPPPTALPPFNSVGQGYEDLSSCTPPAVTETRQTDTKVTVGDFVTHPQPIPPSDRSFSDPPASSSSSFDGISPLIALDRLLDVTARVGLDRLFQLRTLHTLFALKRQTDDPDEQLFTLLYDRLTHALKGTDNIRLSNDD